MLALIGLGELAMAVTIWDEFLDPDDALLFALPPLWMRSAAWATGGLVAVIAARIPRLRQIAWGAVILMPVERLLSYLWSFVLALTPGMPDPTPITLADAVLWGGGVLGIYLLALKADPDK